MWKCEKVENLRDFLLFELLHFCNTSLVSQLSFLKDSLDMS